MDEKRELDPKIINLLGQLYAILEDDYSYSISIDKDISSKIKGNTILLKGDHNYISGNGSDGWIIDNVGTKEYYIIHYYDTKGEESTHVRTGDDKNAY